MADSKVMKKCYKYCIVPLCKSSTIKTPQKIFFLVPRTEQIRKRWCKVMKRDERKNKKLSCNTALYCCEDHFSLPQDMQNYWQWRLMKDVKKHLLKESAIPHIFDCQNKSFVPVERSASNRRKTKCSVQKRMTSRCSAKKPSTSATSEFSHPLPECQDVKDEEDWQYLKGSVNNTLQKGIWRKSMQGVIRFKEILDHVPKREFKYSVKHLDSETDTLNESDMYPQIQDIKFPLVLVSVNSVAGMPDSTVPLLYKLKHDNSFELVSNHVKSRIYSLYIESGNSSEFLSKKNSRVPLLVDESFEAVPNYTLNIPIKLEPLNDGYEDTHSRESTAGTQGNSIFPLMFILRSSVNETSNCNTLIYDLKHNSNGVQVIEAIVSQIASVQINSLSEATFLLKDTSMLKVEGPLNITLQTKPLEAKSNTAFSNIVMDRRKDEENMPIIIDVSSCSDHLPFITD